MALQLSRPDPASPDDVAAASFSTSRKGYDPGEVREFLHMVAAELARLHERERALEQQLRDGERNAFSIAALDDEVITRLMGDEASRILHSARDAAARLKAHTEEAAERMLREAGDEARRIREEAEIEAARRRSDTSADAHAELEMARQQGREMVDEAREYREKVLADVARRRELARRQIEQIVHGRARLIQAFERSRRAADDALAELGPLVDPDELDLSPTTGPVPVTQASPQPESGAVQLFDRDDDPDLAVEHVIDSAPPAIEPAVEIEPVTVETVTVETVSIEPVADIEPVTVETGEVDDREPAPVIALFGSAPAPAPAPVDAVDDEPRVDPSPASGAPRPSVDDLFAKLRAARTQGVAERVVAAPSVVDVTSPRPVEPTAAAEPGDSGDTPFTRRDDALAPLVAAAARKLKRVLADEQNEVLHVLRGRHQVDHIANLVGEEAVHISRYTDAISGELTAAAVAGALSMGASATAAQKDVKRSAAVGRAAASLADDIVRPLRARLERCVATADGDRDELSSLVRPVYREWKNQRIDEHLDDVARVAFGHGALAGVTPGAPICWAIDPDGPPCADAEDNTLGGVVTAGEAFPTEHACAPAHPGCRCMIVPAAT